MPGLTVNLSRSGASLSFGARGAHYTVGPMGQRVTVGLPGTGLFYTQMASRRGRRTTRAASPPVGSATAAPEDRLRLGFWKKLATPVEERELVAGIRAVLQKDEAGALAHMRRAAHLADGAFMAGFLAYKQKLFDEARADLEYALSHTDQLGQTLGRYGASATMSLAITDSLAAHLQPNEEGVLLALVEVCQRQDRWTDAIAYLERLQKIAPTDIVVKVSLAELLLDEKGDDPDTLRRVLDVTSDGMLNSSALHTAALLYRGRALRGLGVFAGAIDVLSLALTRKKDREEELIRSVRYERALVYDQMGQKRRARAELERLYAEDPKFADVEARLAASTTP